MNHSYNRSRSQTSYPLQRRNSNSRDRHSSNRRDDNDTDYSSNRRDVEYNGYSNNQINSNYNGYSNNQRDNGYSSNRRNNNYNRYSNNRSDSNNNNGYSNNQRSNTYNDYSNNQRSNNYNGYSSNQRNNNYNGYPNNQRYNNNNNTGGSHVVTSGGINQSTRNWDAERTVLTGVEKMPLLSRSDYSQDANAYSLKDPAKQRELWLVIKNMIRQAEQSERREDWDDIVKQLRKLREVVFSTMASRDNMDFATEVFELSVVTCIKANNQEELFKCFKRLVEEIYVTYPVTENCYFTALYVLFIKCKRHDHVYAGTLTQKLSKDNEFARYVYNVLECTKKNRSNSFKYFELSKNPPSDDYANIVHDYDDIVRIEAINVIRKAYLSTSTPWIRKWLGLSEECDVIHEINRLQQGDCVKSFDQSRDLVYFLKKRVH